MIVKLQSSDIYLSRLESRLESIFATLSKDESRSAFDLVGDSLDDLKLVRRKIKSEEEMLAEKGLRRVPHGYNFYDGETIVIIAEGEFSGYNAVVKLADSEIPGEFDSTVTVIPTLDLFSLDSNNEEPIELKRTEIAIWDYPDLFEDRYGDKIPSSKRSESSKKVISLLSTLDVANKSTYQLKRDGSNESFKSSRQRKASRKSKKKNK